MEEDDRVGVDDNEENEDNQSGGARGMVKRPEKPAPPSSVVVMEDIVDKLKLLNYEDVFAPISRSYFVNQNKTNPGEQFRTLVEYISWILQDVLKLEGYEPPDQYSDPNATATSLVTELKRVGVVVDSPAKLRLGYGDGVCFALDQLLDLAIQKQGHRMKTPVFPPNMIFSEDEEIYDDEEDIEEEEEAITEESDEEELYIMNKEKKGDLIPRNQVIESDINAQEWKLELEQVAPQLIVRLNVDHKDWRTHVESMSEQEKIITTLLPETTEKLSRISEDISKLTERISKREKMLSDDSSVSVLLQTYRKSQEELEQITSKYKEYEENISSLSNELSSITSELEEVKNEVDNLRKKMGDTTPLNNIKEALQRLKAEIKNMDMRTGVLTDTLLQAKIKTTRAQSASTQRQMKRNHSAGIVPEQYGFDPFAVNNGDSSFLYD